MIPWWLLALGIIGVNFALWGLAGLCRAAGTLLDRWRGDRAAGGWRLAGRVLAGRGRAERGPAYRRLAERGLVERGLAERRRTARQPGAAVTAGNGPAPSGRPLTVRDVAVLVPAHNEALVIADTLRAIMTLVPRRNVHVVSDGSTDDTVALARRAGARVMETSHNMGKAGALAEALARFRIVERFAVVMLLDADTRVMPGYFESGLAMFSQPGVVAVAGCVRTARGRKLTFTGNVLVGHRQRIYAIGQRLLKFGQTWLRTNATHIVPGFASMYRTDVLSSIEMNPPGLVIEDFNMTFEVYQKRLGKVGFTLSAVAVTQDPDNLRDYIKQTKRWAVGLWQTVKRHPPRANLFTAMLALLLLELVTSSLAFLAFPLVVAVLLIPDMASGALSWPWFAHLYTLVAAHLTLSAVVFGVLIPDFALTCLAAVVERQPRLLLLAAFFPVLRLVDAVIGLTAIPVAWLTRSSGRWQSPARRAVITDSSAPPASVPTGPPRPVAAPASQPRPVAAPASQPRPVTTTLTEGGSHASA